MTDDSESQRQALATAWPKATQLFCVFHVQQAFWTWLHEGKNKVRKEHREVLMSKVKELVYAESEQVLGMSLFCFFSHLFFFPAILLFSTYFSEYFA